MFTDSQFSIPGYRIRDHSLSTYTKFSEKYVRNIDIEPMSIRLVVSVGKGRWKINKNTWKIQIQCNRLHWPINFYYLSMSFLWTRKTFAFFHSDRNFKLFRQFLKLSVKNLKLIQWLFWAFKHYSVHIHKQLMEVFYI